MPVVPKELNAEPSLSLFGSSVFRWSTLRPLLLLSALFAAELICISVWLDGASLASQTGLLAEIGAHGSRILRVVVGFSILFVTFAFLRYGAVPGMASSSEAAAQRIRWNLLSLHGAAMLFFGVFSFFLFANKIPSGLTNPAAIVWLAAGVAAIVLAALAFVPADDWLQMARKTGSLWIFALLAAITVSFAGDVASVGWRPLWKLTFQLVEVTLRLFVSPVVVDRANLIISAPHFEVQVAPQCAGFEGMGLILAFGVIWLVLFRKECRFPQALLLLPVGLVLIYLLNVVRITTLLLIGNAGAPQIALGGFHSQAGWIAFAVASLAFCFAAKRVPWIMIHPSGVAAVSDEPNPTAAYLMPFLVILAAGMVSAATSAGFEWLYFLRFPAAAIALYAFRDSYRRLDWRFSWRGIAGGAALFFVWVAMDRFSGVAGAHAMPGALASASTGLRTGWIAFRILAAVITVPIAEELAFRGFLMRRLAGADFESVAWRAIPWTALVVSSLLFGLMHGPRWPAGTLAGLLFGWLAMRQGKIGEAVAAHAATNLMIAVYVLTANQWQLW